MTSGRSVSTRVSWALTLACTVSAFGCGGRVNVGGNAPGGAGGLTDEEPVDPQTPATLRELPRDFYADNLVVAGDYLYLSGYDGTNFGIYRCQKDRCASTFKSVLNLRDPIQRLQAFDQRLGVVTVSDGSGYSWLGSYSLPDCGDPQSVIEGLPDQFSQVPPLFWGNSAYFFIDLDHSLYRCQLPNCADGPHRLSADSQAVEQQPEATGSAVFWISDYQNLARSLDSGRAAAEHLLPGPELKVIPPFDPTTNDPERITVSRIAAADGKLYAALAFGQEQDCRSNVDTCVTTVVRWPAQGSGEREVILTLAAPVAKLFVVGAELVWTTPVDQSEVEMASCRIEACAETKRVLGHLSDQASRVVADGDYLYWLGGREVPADGQLAALPASWYNALIRRVARLPPP